MEVTVREIFIVKTPVCYLSRRIKKHQVELERGAHKNSMQLNGNRRTYLSLKKSTKIWAMDETDENKSCGNNLMNWQTKTFADGRKKT